ncbi:hypothetical protein N9N67_04210 [Bacteriovoracaceae bacterium]|nr:hypothetical protein [Bacteriovoracaceae bacterium]
MKQLAFCLLVMSSFVFSQVIKPGENRGFVKLKFNGDFKTASGPIKFTYKVNRTGGVTKLTDLSKPYAVLKGEGCLILGGTKLLSWSYCGINIKPKQTTNIEVSLVKISWDPKRTWIDLGNKLHLDLIPYVENSYAKFNFPAKPMQVNGKMENQTIILPFVSGHKIQVQYTNVLAYKNQSKTISPIFSSTSMIDVTPRDLRGTIKVLGENLHFATPGTKNRNSSYSRMGNYKLFNFLPKAKEIRKVTLTGALHPRYSLRIRTKLSQNTQRVIWNRLDVGEDKKNSFSLKAFPLMAGEGVYEFLVNNINQSVDVMSNRTLTLKLKSLNIGKLEGKFDGLYRLYQLNPTTKIEKRQLGYAFGCNLTSSSCYPRIDLKTYFPTQTTIEVPFGYTYQIDSYMKVHNGELEFQDTMEVRL